MLRLRLDHTNYDVVFHNGRFNESVCEKRTLRAAKKEAERRWPEITGWDGPDETGWVGYSQLSWGAEGIAQPCSVWIEEA